MQYKSKAALNLLFVVLCSHLAEQRSKATADLARASHTRQAPAPGSASSSEDKRTPSPNSIRKAASTAVQGLRGSFFRHGSFLDLVSPSRSCPQQRHLISCCCAAQCQQCRQAHMATSLGGQSMLLAGHDSVYVSLATVALEGFAIFITHPVSEP